MLHYTIRAADVGQSELFVFGRRVAVETIMMENSRTMTLGSILPMDVGRHLVLKYGDVLAESNAARVARTTAELTASLAAFRTLQGAA